MYWGDMVKNYAVHSLKRLSEIPFYLTEVQAINLVPRLKRLTKNSRFLNGFLYLTAGKIQYTFQGQTKVYSPGTLLYLPTGSAHIYQALTPVVRYVRVDFRLFCAATGQEILFHETITELTSDLNAEIGEKLLLLARLSLNGGSNTALKKQSLLLDIFNDCANLAAPANVPSKGNAVLSCVRFVEENCTKPFTVEQLCCMARLSPTHFRRSFKAATGMSAVKYKNHCRTQLAIQMLKGPYSLGEISDALGFDNENYFYKVFHQNTGITPKEYRRNQQNQY